jgi:hypothetical protein
MTSSWCGPRNGTRQQVRTKPRNEEPDQQKTEDEQGDGSEDQLRGWGNRIDPISVRLEAVQHCEANLRDIDEPKPDRELHRRVSPGDGLATIAAVGAEQNPAENRDVVVPADRVATARTVGTRFVDALVRRQAGDADVQKAAEEQTEDEGGELQNDGKRHTFSIGRPVRDLVRSPARRSCMAEGSSHKFEEPLHALEFPADFAIRAKSPESNISDRHGFL